MFQRSIDAEDVRDGPMLARCPAKLLNPCIALHAAQDHQLHRRARSGWPLAVVLRSAYGGEASPRSLPRPLQVNPRCKPTEDARRRIPTSRTVSMQKPAEAQHGRLHTASGWMPLCFVPQSRSFRRLHPYPTCTVGMLNIYFLTKNFEEDINCRPHHSCTT